MPREMYDVAECDDFCLAVIMAACATEAAAIQWCLKVGLLPRSRDCPSCGEAMRLSPNGKRFRCCRSGCRLERTYKKGSFFEGQGLTIQDAVLLLWFWAKREPSTHAQQMTGHSSHTLTDWYSFCRDICSREMLRSPMQVGGPGHIVEIDETSIKKKSKNNVGARHPDFWLFGGVDRTTNMFFASVVYEDRTKPRLSAEIRKFVLPGSHIMSDMWPSYVTADGRHNIENNPYLEGTDYSHQWVNHSTNFVNPANGAHTQRIEGAFRGYPRHLLPSFIDECLWRVWFFPPRPTPQQFMKGLVDAIKRHY
ncbi:hypothetical protein F441_06123, partial [Phytophthora nicotianae CJ01A1]